MKYPQSFIDELRASLRVSEVIGRYLSIRRAGREYHALCPFHKEKTPSFTINDEKGFFHCFGCGAHGDVIGFIRDYEHLGYREAVERLAAQAGLQVPQMSRSEVERESREQSLQQVVEAAAGWFEDQLAQTSEGELARRYLRERGLSAETMARFRIGYAPADRDALARAMKAKGISEAQLIETGMLIQVEGRAPYARFRRRLMFPIRDRKSRVIAFGGRVLPGEPNEDAPKYLNSPETPLFHKGRQLFNLDQARRPAYEARKLIVCEGYMDVIALAQAGIPYCVAPLGTAITPEQLQLVWQLVDEPTLCLDGDSAGLRAMSRAAGLALPLLIPGKTIRFALLPKGEDPDTLVRTIGRAAFDEVIAQAQPLAAMLWQQVMAGGASTPEARAAQEQELMRRVHEIKHPTVQHYYKQFARDKLREEQQSQYRHSREGGNPARGAQFKNKKSWMPASGGTTNHVMLPPMPRTADASLLNPASNLVALIIAQPALLNDAAAEEFWLGVPMPALWQQQLHQLITELHIENPALDSAQLWQAITDELPTASREHISQALQGLGIELALDETTRHARTQRLWGEVVNDVDRARLRAECAEAETAMAAAMTEENFERFMALKGQLESIERERSRYYQQDPLPAANG
jgi:DNA primase